ncbi:Methyltransferase type 11 [[Leptolyngbya] sp. PCC 7376]|uniref:LynF/TruF/PatF family peptide O-prenyltransferase n=1 Tax=[Leptolyngbya] sp. PCC 7376 TaxID=111781 RepID=UPI00029F3E98|nr:LynF/TruF/PatF family peptide O-prenyltransferase [[Leptolyngbya] sp. PCC 7376]AFY37273.1 Methyltransferase type 11 [[Leptolyngbya] sp. PCC 7376]
MRNHLTNSVQPLQTQATQTSGVEDVRSLYNSNDLNFSRLVPEPIAREHNLALARRIGIQPGHYILDAGCGAGVPAIHIAQAYPGTKIEGMTVSDVEATEAQSRIQLANLGDRLTIQPGDFHHLPFPDGVFNVVFFNDSIKYSNQIPQVLAEVKRVLRPNGILYITDLFLKEPPLSPTEKSGLYKAQQATPHLSHATTLKMMVDYIAQAGFQSIQSNGNMANEMPAQRFRLDSTKLTFPDAPLIYGEVKAIKAQQHQIQHFHLSSSFSNNSALNHGQNPNVQKIKKDIAYNIIQNIDGSKENNIKKNLRCFHEHKAAFNVENFYPLNEFETFLKSQEKCNMDCSCKIDSDKLHAGRFNLVYHNHLNDTKNFYIALTDILNFFGKVESRAGIKLDYQPLQQFLGQDFNFKRLFRVLVGVDAKPEVSESRLKLFVWLRDYPEKVKAALDLYGDFSSKDEIRSLILNDNLLLEFDFHFNNRTEVKLYPTLHRENFLGSHREILGNMLPAKALSLLEMCMQFQIGFSPSNKSNILYFYPFNSKHFLHFIGNEMVEKVQSYYRHQPLKKVAVCIPIAEFENYSINKINLYYSLS